MQIKNNLNGFIKVKEEEAPEDPPQEWATLSWYNNNNDIIQAY